MYKATGESEYLSKAESYYTQFGLDELTGVFSWDDKAVGCSALLAELTNGKSIYVNALKAHCDDATTRQTSAGGEVWWDYPWGSLRYAANSALICLQVNIMKQSMIIYVKYHGLQEILKFLCKMFTFLSLGC